MSESLVRRPRYRLILNGTTTTGCQSVEIVASRGSQASSFHVMASANELSRILGQGWVDQSSLDVAIDFGMLSDASGQEDIDWVRMITGIADRIHFDQITGTVSLDGRDNAGRLIDLPIQESYLNSTSSEVAQKLAQLCSLTADVDPTTQLVGQYYQIQHTKNAFGGFSRHGNGWDLLAELAEIETYDLWVDGTTLHFKEPVSGNNNLYDVIYTPGTSSFASPNLTVSNFSMERSFGLSGDLQVNVASWNSRQRRQVNGSYPTQRDSGARQFLLLKPNLLPDEASALAKSTYVRIRTHQRTVNGTMAGELSLTTRDRLRLSGTGTGWDCTYTIDRIEREMSLVGGFVQHITGRAEPDEGDSSG